MENSNDEIILELYDENKNAVKYVLLDIVNYNEQEYVVLMPENSREGEVEVFKTKHSKDKSATLYTPEKDDYIIMQVYDTFKDRYEKEYKGRIKFDDWK